MAYNVLKGIVEGSVDQHADQEISGIKVFKNTISASVFYDTDAESPCATIKDLAIKEIVGGSKNSVLSLAEEGKVNANYNLTFDGETLKTKNITADAFVGSGAGLTEIPTNKFKEKISADSIEHSHGIHSVRGTLQVKAHAGLSIEDNAVGVSLAKNGALCIKDSHLVVDPTKTETITAAGQNLSDNDLLLVSDTSRSSVAHTTLSNFYEGYIKNKVSHAAGTTNEVQLKGKSGFNSSSKLSYNTDKNTLNIDGKIAAATLHVEGDLRCDGAVINSIKTISTRMYEVQSEDYTLLCDTVDSPVTVMLPPACNHPGRMLNIKKACTNKYKLNSYPVVLKVQEGTIDLTEQIVLKTNYALRAVQSDGNSWWIIGAKGT
jgi:hypothetical protein|tara:strand:+ start:2664 stop:3791 length:1128 start_codon:yes stop_codon:yes gene_type:complete